MNLGQRLGRRSSRGPGGSPVRRGLPDDWPLAARAGAESVVLGWGLVVLPTLVLYLLSSSRDAAAALSLGGVLRTGTGLWSLGFGGSLGAGAAEYGTLSLPLLGLTLLQAWITRACVRRARPSGPRAGAVTVCVAALTALAIVAATHPATSRTGAAVIGITVLTAAVTAAHLQRVGRGWRKAADRWAQRPQWSVMAVRLCRETALALAVLAGAVALVGLIAGAGRVSRLHDALVGGDLAGTAGLALLQLGWLPTGLVWALSWVAGPGFVVGTGSVFSPTRVLAGAVPALPLLGGLPTGALGAGGALLPFLIAAAAAVAAWRHRQALRELPLRQAALTTLIVALVLGAGVLLACLAASGQVGPGRMTEVGPRSGYVAAIVLLMVLFGVGVVAVLPHPRTRALTGRGVRATAAATSAAADNAWERLRGHAGRR
ncbi:hypothetical protein GZ998_10060 [Actinomyces sp. 594]|uniref:cell division protein PerM n=1 Tax=Actinomyces sp. 594 TaxID=2057793 RepID=UPI001C59C7D7|nr:DUF6350 family protein [Actinomyces sp. 594]MBW3069840.1 hypothetical protein [Actinomyces sp. 594]